MKKCFYPILGLIILSLSKPSYAQSEFWGMTTKGGTNGVGTIFKTDGNANNHTVVYNFEDTTSKQAAELPRPTQMIVATNAKLYGVVYEGGKYGKGVIMEYTRSYTPDSTGYKELYDFGATSNDGEYPVGGLIEGDSGKLYGMTYQGGVFNDGTIFEYDLNTQTYTIKYHFGSISDGEHPQGQLLKASNGKIYGVTEQGGTGSGGTLFEFTPATGGVLVHHEFIVTADGAMPQFGLTEVGNDTLYSTTTAGGQNSQGVLYRFITTNNTFQKQLDFGSATFGSQQPSSPLLYDQFNDKIYGTTAQGGAQGNGQLFEYNRHTNSYDSLHNFQSGIGSGQNPVGGLGLIFGSIYGTTANGGSQGNGVIYSFNPSFGYQTQVDFNSFYPGVAPQGLSLQAYNDLYETFWGFTNTGGAHNKGIFFEYSPVSSFGFKIKDLGSVDVVNAIGKEPEYNLIHASNDKFYGVAQGGKFDKGVLFEYNRQTGQYRPKYHFGQIANSSPANPSGALFQASDGHLYGLTTNGGSQDEGTLYRFDITYETTTVLKSFGIATTATYAPIGEIIEINGILYGTVEGYEDYVFSYNLSNNNFKLREGDFRTGNRATIALAPNGKCYGMSESMASCIEPYMYDPVQDTIIPFFMGTLTLCDQNARMELAADGKLYGTANGNSFEGGHIYQIDPATNTYTIVDTVKVGDYRLNGLLSASNGKLYGMAAAHLGNTDPSFIYEYDPQGGGYTKVMDFTGINGEQPVISRLLEIGTVITATPKMADNSKNDFLNCYPNPANQVLHIAFKLSQPQEKINIQLVDMHGRTILNVEASNLQEGLQQYQINTQTLANGVYALMVSGENIAHTKRVIVKH